MVLVCGHATTDMVCPIRYPDVLVIHTSIAGSRLQTVRAIDVEVPMVGSSLDPHSAKVAWEEVCKPKAEGGLRIKRVQEWNDAATLKHIWHLLSDPEDVV